MSGIIHSRYDEVLETYKELGFELLEKRVKGEWIAMAMKKVK
jgi:ribosomal protein L11 methylase PrmA